jgi:hypothetical protein
MMPKLLLGGKNRFVRRNDIVRSMFASITMWVGGIEKKFFHGTWPAFFDKPRPEINVEPAKPY